MIDIENQIADKEKELLRVQENYSTVQMGILEIELKITNLKNELSPLKIAKHQSLSIIKRIKVELNMLNSEYWRQRRGMA